MGKQGREMIEPTTPAFELCRVAAGGGREGGKSAGDRQARRCASPSDLIAARRRPGGLSARPSSLRGRQQAWVAISGS